MAKKIQRENTKYKALFWSIIISLLVLSLINFIGIAVYKNRIKTLDEYQYEYWRDVVQKYPQYEDGLTELRKLRYKF